MGRALRSKYPNPVQGVRTTPVEGGSRYRSSPGPPGSWAHADTTGTPMLLATLTVLASSGGTRPCPRAASASSTGSSLGWPVPATTMRIRDAEIVSSCRHSKMRRQLPSDVKSSRVAKRTLLACRSTTVCSSMEAVFTSTTTQGKYVRASRNPSATPAGVTRRMS